MAKENLQKVKMLVGAVPSSAVWKARNRGWSLTIIILTLSPCLPNTELFLLGTSLLNFSEELLSIDTVRIRRAWWIFPSHFIASYIKSDHQRLI
ncbi:MAG: hypothetical protein O7D34_00880, partial [Ignavibacteria bacterium]|nr:hypothetical protein [Ignavibacteria bacterium]